MVGSSYMESKLKQFASAQKKGGGKSKKLPKNRAAICQNKSQTPGTRGSAEAPGVAHPTTEGTPPLPQTSGSPAFT